MELPKFGIMCYIMQIHRNQIL